jgi:hypothetical protein
MRKHLLILAALAALVLPALAAEQAAEVVRWHTYEDGLRLAAESGKPVFIDFSAEWCRYCKKMDAETFADPRIAALLNEHFVPVAVDTDHERAPAQKFGVTSLPTFWFLESDGRPIDHLGGFVEADIFRHVLGFIYSRSFEKMEFDEYVRTQQS